ncbi:hypothetical protein BH10ACT5_BH10ACT5_05460 [soil metagenome]
MNSLRDDPRSLRIAAKAFALIQTEVRPLVASGGRLWSKGSGGYPSRLRQMLEGLDKGHEVTFATDDAMKLPLDQRVVEHVIPVKRIIVEIVDPSQADPRSNPHTAPIAGGPATSPEHLVSIYDQLLQMCWVTREEHARLNRAGQSLQWDAPDGDGWARYRLAGVVAHRLPSITVTTAPAGWIFERTADDSVRFVLGTIGTNPLICIGVNPSTATPEHLDQTLRRVRGYAERNGNDSWVMLNLYPQRSTDPQGMHDVYLPELKAENERRIAERVGGGNLTLLAAWGEPIMARSYLSKMLEDIVKITTTSSCDWVSIGELTDRGHPRHPSRGAYLPLHSFDVDAYLLTLEHGP